MQYIATKKDINYDSFFLKTNHYQIKKTPHQYVRGRRDSDSQPLPCFFLFLKSLDYLMCVHLKRTYPGI